MTVGASGLVGLISAHAVHAAPVGLSASLVAAVVNVPAAAATKLTAIEHGLDLLALAKGKMAILAGVCGLILIGAGLVFQPRKPGPGGGLKLPGGTGAPDVCLGHTHGLVLASDGSLWSWGTNFLGWPVLGLGDIHRQTSLRRMGDENDWIAIASSDTHSLALKSDGSMWAWGANLYGQLGIGWPDRRDRRNTQRRTPTPSAPGNDWKQVAAGGSHSLALKRDGTLWGWGNNWSGQVGIESTAKEVHEVTQVGTGTNWTRIWSCGIQSVGQQSDGSLWFWGSLTGSDKDSHRFLVPTRVSEDTNSGRFYHLLKKQDGSLWALDALDYATIDKTHYTPIAFRRVQLQKDVVAFATSDTSRNPAGVALTRDGEVWTWGQVFGEYTPESPKMRSWARSLGWKTDRFDGKPVMRDEPWLLPVEE